MRMYVVHSTNVAFLTNVLTKIISWFFNLRKRDLYTLLLEKKYPITKINT